MPKRKFPTLKNVSDMQEVKCYNCGKYVDTARRVNLKTGRAKSEGQNMSGLECPYCGAAIAY